MSLWISWLFEMKGYLHTLSRVAQQDASNSIDLTDENIQLPAAILSKFLFLYFQVHNSCCFEHNEGVPNPSEASQVNLFILQNVNGEFIPAEFEILTSPRQLGGRFVADFLLSLLDAPNLTCPKISTGKLTTQCRGYQLEA